MRCPECAITLTWHKDRDVALCHADFDPEADGDAAADQPIAATSTTGYLRLRRDDYDEAALTAWVGRVRADAAKEPAHEFAQRTGLAPGDRFESA